MKRNYEPMDLNLKRAIVARVEAGKLRKYIVKPDGFEYVGSIGEDHFYYVILAGNSLNGDTVSLEYLKLQGVC